MNPRQKRTLKSDQKNFNNVYMAMNHRGEDLLRVALRASGAVGHIADVQDARGAVGTPVPTSTEGIQNYQMLAA